MSEFFYTDGSYIYCNKPTCEFYIPKHFFDETNKYAEDLGNTIRTLGVFDIAFFDEKGKVVKSGVLKLPSMIEIFNADSEERDVQLPMSSEPIPCKVITYHKGVKIMGDSIIKDTTMTEKYMDFICKGKVPEQVPYSKSLALWRKNLELTGANLGVPSTIMEMVLSNSYRYKKDPAIKFAAIAGKDKNVSEYDYDMRNIRDICRYTSTFVGITWEDIDVMITTSLNRSRKNKEEQYVPTEFIMKL
jgi:hypothetical protein